MCGIANLVLRFMSICSVIYTSALNSNSKIRDFTDLQLETPKTILQYDFSYFEAQQSILVLSLSPFENKRPISLIFSDNLDLSAREICLAVLGRHARKGLHRQTIKRNGSYTVPKLGVNIFTRNKIRTILILELRSSYLYQ